MTETQDERSSILGMLIDVANKLQMLGDRHFLSAGLTTKQWYLCVLLEQFGEYAPTLGEMAKEMGSSYQNVKQIALKLEKKGLLCIEKDLEDSRKLRLSISKTSQEYWKSRAEKDREFIAMIFEGRSKDEVTSLYLGLQELHERIAMLVHTMSEEEEENIQK
jgi:DNA-binding MarR family transcriptional regulator